LLSESVAFPQPLNLIGEQWFGQKEQLMLQEPSVFILSKVQFRSTQSIPIRGLFQ
jgi:hypothetical protein